jgi:hypothetical protein
MCTTDFPRDTNDKIIWLLQSRKARIDLLVTTAHLYYPLSKKTNLNTYRDKLGGGVIKKTRHKNKNKKKRKGKTYNNRKKTVRNKK